mgnify:CR=1 FL=1
MKTLPAIELALLGALAVPAVAADWQPAYTNDFSAEKTGENEPEGLLILDGAFEIAQTDGNKSLRLPAEPLDEFGFLFGPRVPGDLAVQCRFLSERKGRRTPTFSIALGGVTGFRLKLNTPHRKLQLLKDKDVVAETSFTWQSGQWLTLRLQRVRLPAADTWEVAAKAWHGRDEPAGWNLQHKTTVRQTAGKCSVWAAPYSTHEIYFDDIAVFSTLSSPEIEN